MHYDEFWIGPAQLALTAALARSVRDLPGESIEVGTWQGLSAIPIARAVAPEPFHVVDHWLGDEPEAAEYAIQRHLVDERDNYGIFLSNLTDACVTNVVIHKMAWRDFAKGWDQPIRFLHIDASHTANEVSDNIEMLLPFAVDGAVFCGDDYGFPQVAEGVHRQFTEVNHSENKLWWKIIGDDSEGREYGPHLHPLAQTRAYMSSLAEIREMFIVTPSDDHRRDAELQVALSGSNGTF